MDVLHQSICLVQQLPELTESCFFLGFCFFSGDAWIYCISKNEWVPFEHNYSEKPRYGRNSLEIWYRRAVEALGGGWQRTLGFSFPLCPRGAGGCVLPEFRAVRQQETEFRV